MRSQYGIIISIIAGAIIGLLIRNYSFNPYLIAGAIAGVGIIGVMIGFYADYSANFDLRDDEPILVKSLVMNVLGVVCGAILSIILIVFGGI